MNLGASRWSSSTWVRVTGLAATTALLCATGGIAGAGAASAQSPYPPTAPCALSWTQNDTDQPVLVGSGYGTNTPVAVTLYPQARSLGSYATNASGAFTAPLDVSDSAPKSWITATSTTRSCSVVPPPPTGTAPPAPTPPTGGSTTTPPPGTSSSTATTGPTAGSTPTDPAGGGGSSAPAGTGSSPAGGGNATNGGAGGTGNSPQYPPRSLPSRGASTPASGSSPSSTPASTAPTRTGTSSSSPTETLRQAPLGLPLTAIVIIAVLLLLGGGLGVLFLTRRSG